MNRFTQTLAGHSVSLRRSRAEILQVNVGKLCNLICVHCHVNAGPRRKEIMSRETIDRIMDHKLNYFISAVRDAQAQKLIDAPDPVSKAKALFSCYQGTMAQARIQNDIELLSEFKQVAKDVLGVKRARAVATR